jgi:hypothetical protein
MRKLFLISAILSVSALQAAGQLHPLIQSDRPGQAQTPIAVGKKYLQWQQGYEMGQLQYNGFTINSEYKAMASNSNTLFRMGITQKTEFNFGFTADQRRLVPREGIGPLPLPPLRPFNWGIRQFDVGARHTFFTSNEKDYDLGMLAWVQFNTDPITQNRFLRFRLALLLGKEISSKMNFTGNFGMNWDSNFATPDLYVIANLSRQLGNNFNVFGELKTDFNLAINGTTQHLLDGGFSWMLAPNFLLDIYGGWTRNSQLLRVENYWFGALGLSWKIKALPSQPKSQQP